MRKLQRVQNLAAKLILMKQKRDSATECRQILHWLPIKARIEFKILLLVHKCMINTAPEYLKNLIIQRKERRQGMRSESRSTILEVPFTKRKTFAERSFSVAGPKLWNNLPCKLRTERKIEVLKRNLKTYLFKREYNV